TPPCPDGRSVHRPPFSRGLFKAPVPGLVEIAVAVAPRVGQAEAVAAGMALQPGELRGVLEVLLQRGRVARPDVHGAAAVVLAAAGRGVDGEDLPDQAALGLLAADQRQLEVETAERR